MDPADALLVLLQPGRRISVEEAGEGTPVSLADRSDSGGGSTADAGEQLQSHVSVEDDGASGVGAAAAAAVSVALARSWASAAQQVLACSANQFCFLTACYHLHTSGTRLQLLRYHFMALTSSSLLCAVTRHAGADSEWRNSAGQGGVPPDRSAASGDANQEHWQRQHHALQPLTCAGASMCRSNLRSERRSAASVHAVLVRVARPHHGLQVSQPKSFTVQLHSHMQNGSLAASARSRYRNESAPSLMKLAGDGGSGSPGGSVHGQQLLGALPPGSPSPRKSADEAPLLLGGRASCSTCVPHVLCIVRRRVFAAVVCAVQPSATWRMCGCLLEPRMCCNWRRVSLQAPR